MANIEHFIPHIIKWEAGTSGKGLSNEALFNKARARGYSNNKSDRGGATFIGVTLATYTAYRKRKGYNTTTVDDLKAMTYEVWKDLLKTLFWNKWKADQIKNQSLAELVVDWYWGSGIWGIKNPQQVLGVTNDGVVGAQTIGAMNSGDTETIYKRIWKRRKNYYYGIATNNPTQKIFLAGWLNRLNDLHYEKN